MFIVLIETIAKILVLIICYLATVHIGFLFELDLSGLASFVVFSVVVSWLTIDLLKKLKNK